MGGITLKRKKVFALVLCMVMVAVISVAGTFAYLTSKTDVVQNTFTVGKVAITLDEAAVGDGGQAMIFGADRVMENEYHLIPGCHYWKDPTVHVDANSEKAWLFVKIEINNKSVIEDELDLSFSILEGFDASKWEVMSNTDENDVRTYVLAYKTKVEGGQNVQIFSGFSVPKALTNEDLAKLEDFKINVEAFAIQADGFASYTDAYPQVSFN